MKLQEGTARDILIWICDIIYQYVHFNNSYYSGSGIMAPGKSKWKHIHFAIFLAQMLHKKVYCPYRERSPVLRHHMIYCSLNTCFLLLKTWFHCPACRTSLIATGFWVVVICPIIKCLTVLEFSFILFDLCLFITIFNFILNYVPIVTFWIFTYHKIWILLIIFCFIWNYWIIYFLTCLEVFWSVVS